MQYKLANMPTAGDTVVVAMSGGVDSTVVAMLLLQNGCRVIGVTMTLVQNDFPTNLSGSACFCDNSASIQDCRDFCSAHNIDYHVVDLSAIYKEKVLNYVTTAYLDGTTPNPCVRCNEYVKFGALLDAVDALNIKYDFFCTGHYAKIVRPTQQDGTVSKDAPYLIARCLDDTKDQTYFLHRLSSTTLQKVRFPLCTIKKTQVFQIASEAGLAVAHKKESEDFATGGYFSALFQGIGGKAGEVVDLAGHVLGQHKGIENYTIGKRRGLGISVNYPIYVQTIDATKNKIIVAPEKDLYSSGLVAGDFVWAGGVVPHFPLRTFAKIRLASVQVAATVRYESGSLFTVDFDAPQKAVTAGQSVVLYNDADVIIGGGVILHPKPIFRGQDDAQIKCTNSR